MRGNADRASPLTHLYPQVLQWYNFGPSCFSCILLITHVSRLYGFSLPCFNCVILVPHVSIVWFWSLMYHNCTVLVTQVSIVQFWSLKYCDCAILFPWILIVIINILFLIMSFLTPRTYAAHRWPNLVSSQSHVCYVSSLC